MRLPIITWKEYENKINNLESQIAELGQAKINLESRIRDLERQFAIEYDEAGKIVKTLADVPVDDRANVKVLRHPKRPLAGMNWQQRKRWLEETDGGRRLVNG